MNIDEFREALIEALGEQFPDYTFSTQYVSKINGQSYNGILGRHGNDSVAPVVDVQQVFDSFQRGEATLQEAVDRMEKAFRDAFDVKLDIEPSDMSDYSKMKEFLILQLIPVKGNEERLQEIPHERLSDLALICRFEMNKGTASTIVNNSFLQTLGITKEQLFIDAKENAVRLHPPTLKNLMAVLFQGNPEMMSEQSPLYVATTDIGVQGACVLGYPGFLEESAKSIGGSFYVIPSSIHELLFIRDDSGQTSKELDEMVKGVNQTEVSPAERLSDVSYHYDAETMTFERGSEWEERREREAGQMEKEGQVQEKEEQMQGRDVILSDEPAALPTISALLVNAEAYPKMIELSSNLESLQQAVQGNIEVVYPFDEPVGIICNEEGKLNGMKLNRALRDEEGNIQDILTGPFLVVGLGEEDFRSLTKEEAEKYENLFHQPEVFVRMGKGIVSVPIPDEAINKEKDSKPKVKKEEHGAL